MGQEERVSVSQPAIIGCLTEALCNRVLCAVARQKAASSFSAPADQPRLAVKLIQGSF